jgi:hypothetical protein
VSRVEKAVYMKILRYGALGIDNETLCAEMEEEGCPPAAVKGAVKKLLKPKHVSDTQGTSASIRFKEIPGTRKMRVEAEEVVPGHAVVWVGGRWRARLLPENHVGPKELIKKGMRFNALCSLYYDEVLI